MNHFINKLEKRFGKYAIKNVSLYLALLYALGYLIEALNIGLLNYLSLNPYAILRGQIWRLVTWIIIPPSLGINVLFMLLLLYVFYNFGTSLERALGTFRYNLYILSGMIFTVFGSFILMAYVYIFQSIFVASPETTEVTFIILATQFSTFYVYMSIFLALAVVIPDMTILLMFILPVKMKYMGIVYGFVILLNFIQSNIYNRIVIAASLLNFLLFFFWARKRNHPSPKQIIRRAVYKNDVKKVRYIAKHKCAVCGVTEDQDPGREFRFCSKCQGNYEYCDQHLYTHAHVTKELDS